ncbi:MAG: hypothetical protein EVJ46_06470 [Candidatus Acididesulfobacter guangdongensis]|jgi:hypothetical protein|uniref:Uncharacterized protein n=1 Tax=Acididesulfobacter guangdongensis TaxID=2597225 RepID=A0A519BEZ2_ACIG2|nr:MAG: hypothetical protein EVJ46_06470 [Candidatus Acididesulfobacter guangdongensis]
MFIAELIFFTVEIFFLIYLVIKRKDIVKEMRKLRLERQSVINLKEAIEEDFIPEIEMRKNKIIDEFTQKLYNYHFN